MAYQKSKSPSKSHVPKVGNAVFCVRIVLLAGMRDLMQMPDRLNQTADLESGLNGGQSKGCPFQNRFSIVSFGSAYFIWSYKGSAVIQAL